MTLSLPPRGSSPTVESRRPTVVVGADDAVPVRATGSVTLRVAGGLCETVVCNNNGHDVTRYVFDMAAGWHVLEPFAAERETLAAQIVQGHTAVQQAELERAAAAERAALAEQRTLGGPQP